MRADDNASNCQFLHYQLGRDRHRHQLCIRQSQKAFGNWTDEKPSFSVRYFPRKSSLSFASPGSINCHKGLVQWKCHALFCGPISIFILTFNSFANMQSTDENPQFAETESLGKLLKDGKYLVAGHSGWLITRKYVAFFGPQIRRRSDSYVSSLDKGVWTFTESGSKNMWEWVN